MEHIKQSIEIELFNPLITQISDIQGYKYDDENKIALFGTKVGPIHSIIDGLLHEIAHTAEVKELECLIQYSFGLQIRTTVEVFGKIYYEPITWNATKLEARVILWQEVLCNFFNLPFNRNEFATCLQYMPDFTCVPVKGYKFDSDACKYLDSNGDEFIGDLNAKDNFRFQSIYDYMTEQKATGLYTFSEFKRRWKKVNQFLTNKKTQYENNF